MISFDVGGGRFNYRVVGVCVHDGHVLLHRADYEDFWSLPGGRGEMMEPSPDTLRREFREELGCSVEVERLLWVVENFLAYGDRRYHELALYYKVRLEDGQDLRDRTRALHGVEGSVHLVFQWFALRELTSIRLYPSFLREGLQALPEAVQHVVHWDE